MNRSPTPAELVDLLARVAQADRKAYGILYKATSPKLFALALRILGRRDLAEEALQDAFVNIWHHAANYQVDKAAVMTWMTAIVRNRCLDILRSLPDEYSLAEDDSFDDWLSDDLGPLELAATNQETKAMLNCMKQLSPMQRQAIALSYFKGLAHEELSQQMMQPLGSIKTWIRRGLQTLKTCMDKS